MNFNNRSKNFSAYGFNPVNPVKTNHNNLIQKPANFTLQDASYLKRAQKLNELVKHVKEINEFKNSNLKKVENELPEQIEKPPIIQEVQPVQEKPQRKFIHKTDEEIQQALLKSKELNEKYKNTFNEMTSSDELFSTVIDELFSSSPNSPNENNE
jgi:oligoendopeptidase F